MLDTAAITVRSAKAHTRVTNNLHELHGVDGRSAEGKRYRDLLDSLILEFGAHDPARLREIAMLKFMLEREQVSGACTLENIVRLHNVIERKERALRASKRAASATPTVSLAAKLAAKYQKAAS